MSQVLGVLRRAPKETVSYEAFAGLDGQGMPSYDSSVDVTAHVREYSGANGEQYITTADGSQQRVTLTLWVEGDALLIPEEQGRITRGGRSYIIMEKKSVSRLRNPASLPSHVRLRCRSE